MKSFFVENKITHNYRGFQENFSLFGDNFKFVRFNYGIGNEPYLRIVQPNQSAGVKQSNTTTEANNSSVSSKQSITDSTSTTIRSMAELESLLKNGESGRTIDMRNSQVSPEVWMALARGDEVRVNLQQRAPERVNLFTPLFASIMQLVGGLNGAAYNEKLTEAVRGDLNKAADFVKRHGTSYSMNLLGGAEHIDVDATFTVLPKDKKDEHKTVDYTVKVPDLPNLTGGRRISDDISPPDRFRGSFDQGDPRFFSSEGYRELNSWLQGNKEEYKNHVVALREEFTKLTTTGNPPLSQDKAAEKLGFYPETVNGKHHSAKQTMDAFLNKVDFLFGPTKNPPMLERMMERTDQSNPTSPNKLDVLLANVGLNRGEITGKNGTKINNAEDFFREAAKDNLTDGQKQAFSSFLTSIDSTNQEFKKAVNDNGGIFLSRNDVARIVFDSAMVNGGNGVVYGGNAYASTALNDSQTRLRDGFTSTTRQLGGISNEEQSKAMLLLAYASKLSPGGNAADLHRIAGDLLKPGADFAKLLSAKTGVSEETIRANLTTLQQTISSNGDAKAALASMMPSPAPKLSFIEDYNPGNARDRSLSKLDSGQLNFMATELILRHRTGSDGNPIDVKMDGKIGPQHMTGIQELAVARAEALTDVAQILNGESPLSGEMKDAEWNLLAAKVYGVPAGQEPSKEQKNELKRLVKGEGSVSDPENARIDDVLQALENLTVRNTDGSVNSLKTDAIRAGASAFRTEKSESSVKTTTIAQLSDNQLAAFRDVISRADIPQEKKTAFLALLENKNLTLDGLMSNLKDHKPQLMQAVSGEIGALRSALTNSNDGMNLERHPEIAQLMGELGRVEESVLASANSESTGMTTEQIKEKNVQEAKLFHEKMNESVNNLLTAANAGAKTVNGKPIGDVIQELEGKYREFLLMGFPLNQDDVVSMANKFSEIRTKSGLNGFAEVRDSFLLAIEGGKISDNALNMTSREDSTIAKLSLVGSGQTTAEAKSPELTKRMIDRLNGNEPIKTQMKSIMNDNVVSNSELNSLFSAMANMGEQSAKEFFGIAERLLRHAKGSNDSQYVPDLSSMYESFKQAGKSHAEALRLTLESGQKAVPNNTAYTNFLSFIESPAYKSTPPNEQKAKLQAEFAKLPEEMRATGSNTERLFNQEIQRIDHKIGEQNFVTEFRQRALQNGDISNIPSQYADVQEVKEIKALVEGVNSLIEKNSADETWTTQDIRNASEYMNKLPEGQILNDFREAIKKQMEKAVDKYIVDAGTKVPSASEINDNVICLFPPLPNNTEIIYARLERQQQNQLNPLLGDQNLLRA